MPYTGDPSHSEVDAVRFWLDDVADPPMLSDAEIEYMFDSDPASGADPLLVAAACATKLAARFTGEVSISADGVSYSGDQLAGKYLQLATELREESTRRAVTGAKPVFASNHYVPRSFRIGMYDNPQAGLQGPLPIEHLEWHEPLDPANYHPEPY